MKYDPNQEFSGTPIEDLKKKMKRLAKEISSLRKAGTEKGVKIKENALESLGFYLKIFKHLNDLEIQTSSIQTIVWTNTKVALDYNPLASLNQEETSPIQNSEIKLQGLSKSIGSTIRKHPTALKTSVDGLDLDLLLKLIRENKHSSQKLQGKDVVACVGKTGAGKTTTLTWLSGAEMIRQRVQKRGLSGHLFDSEVIESRTPLEGFRIGHTGTSETRTIGCHALGNLFFCDTPGFEDTAGPEMDIANCVGVSNALQNCQTVRVLLIINSDSLSVDRGQVLIELLTMMARFMRGVSGHLESKSVIPLFTHAPDRHEKIHQALENILTSERAQQDQSITDFTNYLINCLVEHKKTIIIDPMESKPQDVHEIIASSPPILNPERVFGIPLTNEASLTLSSKCQHLREVLKEQLNSAFIDEALQTMLDLELLNAEIREENISRIFEQCKESVDSTVIETATRFRNASESRLVREMKIYLDALEKMECLKKYMNKIAAAAYFEMRSQLGETCKELENEIRFGQPLQNRVTTLAIIHEGFMQHLLPEIQNLYPNLLKDLDARFQLLVKEITTLLMKVESLLPEVTFPSQHTKTQMVEYEFPGQLLLALILVGAFAPLSTSEQYIRTFTQIIGDQKDQNERLAHQIKEVVAEFIATRNIQLFKKKGNPCLQLSEELRKKTLLYRKDNAFAAIAQVLQDHTIIFDQEGGQVIFGKGKHQILIVSPASGVYQLKLPVTCLPSCPPFTAQIGSKLHIMKEICDLKEKPSLKAEDAYVAVKARLLSMVVEHENTFVAQLSPESNNIPLLRSVFYVLSLISKSEDIHLHFAEKKWHNPTDTARKLLLNLPLWHASRRYDLLDLGMEKLNCLMGLDASFREDAAAEWSQIHDTLRSFFMGIKNKLAIEHDTVEFGKEQITLIRENFFLLQQGFPVDSRLGLDLKRTCGNIESETASRFKSLIERLHPLFVKAFEEGHLESIKIYVGVIDSFIPVEDVMPQVAVLHDSFVNSIVEIIERFIRLEETQPVTDRLKVDLIKIKANLLLSYECFLQVLTKGYTSSRKRNTGKEIKPDSKLILKVQTEQKRLMDEVSNAVKVNLATLAGIIESHAIRDKKLPVKDRQLSCSRALTAFSRLRELELFFPQKKLEEIKVINQKFQEEVYKLGVDIDTAIDKEALAEALSHLQTLETLKPLDDCLEGSLISQKLRDLRANYLRKGMKLKEDLPAKLQKRAFREVAEIFEKLSASPDFMDELKASVTLVCEYFTSILEDTSRRRPESGDFGLVSLMETDTYFRDAKLLDKFLSGRLTQCHKELSALLQKRIALAETHCKECLDQFNFVAFAQILSILESMDYEDLFRHTVHRITATFPKSRHSLETTLRSCLREGRVEQINELFDTISQAIKMPPRAKGKEQGKSKSSVSFLELQEFSLQAVDHELFQLMENLEKAIKQELVITLSTTRLDSIHSFLESPAGRKLNKKAVARFQEVTKVLVKVKEELLFQSAPLDPHQFKKYLEILCKSDTQFLESISKNAVNVLKGIQERLHKYVLSFNPVDFSNIAFELSNLQKIDLAFGKLLPRDETSTEPFRKVLWPKIEELIRDIDALLDERKWDTFDEKMKTLELAARYLPTEFPLAKEKVTEFKETLSGLYRKLAARHEYLNSRDFLIQQDIREINLAFMDILQTSQVSRFLGLKSLIPYDKAIEKLKSLISSYDLNALWENKKYSSIGTLLLNLGDAALVSNHQTLYNFFKAYKTDVTTKVRNLIKTVKERAIESYRSGKYDALRPLLEQMQGVQDGLVGTSLHSGLENPIVSALKEDNVRRVQEFQEKKTQTCSDVCAMLRKLQVIVSKISIKDLEAHIVQLMNDLLTHATTTWKISLGDLAYELGQSTLGKELMEGDTFSHFKSERAKQLTAKLAQVPPETALGDMHGNDLDLKDEKKRKILRDNYFKFNTEYLKLLENYITGDIKQLIAETTKDVKIISGGKIKEHLPILMARLFAIWSVLNSRAVFEKTRELDVIIKPHPVQIYAIFRLLGLDTQTEGYFASLFSFGSSDAKLASHLIQILTGEGKSILLGILSTLLALLGFDVFCACYSKYLSDRDYGSFEDFFSNLGVSKNVHYSTLSDLTSKIINEENDIREFTKQFIEKGERPSRSIPKKQSRPRILLIDEVDVFFSKDFYGATYNPVLYLKNDEISTIIDYIWKRQFEKLWISEIKKLPAYAKLTKKFPKFIKLIDNNISVMIQEVQKFKDPPYEVIKDKLGRPIIGYKDIGGDINTKINYGYRTMFAYLNEKDKKEFGEDPEMVGLRVECGQFSYSEFPKQFTAILGVTGTLEALGKFEKNLVQKEYCIEKQTFTAPYHWTKLRQEIDFIRKTQPVLVFFDSVQAIADFKKAQGFGLDFNEINETTANIDFYIKRATQDNQVTLLLKVYGRGLDFICRSDNVERNGGVHVIQTFFSADITEEIQIKGRTARQGKRGTFSQVLLFDDLKKFAVTEPEIKDIVRESPPKIYDFLNAKRVKAWEESSEERKVTIDSAKSRHSQSVSYQRWLTEGKNRVEKMIEFLEASNPGTFSADFKKSRTICLSDATGSMASVWKSAKIYIREMLERISNIGGKGCTELQWVAYRDYGDGSRLLEKSGWSEDPNKLLQFIETINPDGGGDGPEAIEAALEYANTQDGVTNIILIGDAEPHMEGKGAYCEFHKRNLHTDYLCESKKLAGKKIPVHTFHMNSGATLVSSFTQIASITGGSCSLFSDANKLIDVVAQNVLLDVGGEKLVSEYRKAYLS